MATLITDDVGKHDAEGTEAFEKYMTASFPHFTDGDMKENRMWLNGFWLAAWQASRMQQMEGESSEWKRLIGPGYTMEVTHFSNKGPMIVVTHEFSGDKSTIRYDLDTGHWNLD